MFFCLRSDASAALRFPSVLWITNAMSVHSACNFQENYFIPLLKEMTEKMMPGRH
jgi:hypothetical protein